MHYHNLIYPFGWHGGSGGSNMLINGLDEALNFRYMFLFRFIFQVYT